MTRMKGENNKQNKQLTSQLVDQPFSSVRPNDDNAKNEGENNNNSEDGG